MFTMYAYVIIIYIHSYVRGKALKGPTQAYDILIWTKLNQHNLKMLIHKFKLSFALYPGFTIYLNWINIARWCFYTGVNVFDHIMESTYRKYAWFG